MANKKTIVVFGATGAQGGGLVRAILNDSNSEFAVRAVTRDVNSDKARELARLGAEVVAADVDDAVSIRKALKGAYGAFFVTFFWDHFSPERETAQAQAMAQAASEANLTHVIWSTLEDTRKFVSLADNSIPTLHERYKVPHFDGKGQSDRYFTEAGVPTTFLLASYYWENLIFFGMGPQKAADGNYYITFPMGAKKMAGIGAEDIGRCAYGIFKKGPSLAGKYIGIAGEQLTCDEMAKALSSALGRPISYNEVTPEQYRGFGFPGADDLGNMFQFYRDYDEVCNTSRDVTYSRELNPSLRSFTAWLSENKSRIPIE